MITEVLIVFAALAGFFIAFYIQQKKRQHQTLVCPLHADCDTVVHSEFSSFLGVPLEYLGMLYYALVASSYLAFLALPTLATQLATFLILSISAAAFLFSLYLTFIQAFYLKQWCSWCLLSAILSTTVFVLAAASSRLGFVDLLAEHHTWLVASHMLGLAFGLAGATITDVFFFRFLRDFRISQWEAEIMRTLSQVIWFGLAILVISGIGLYLPQASALNQSAKYLVKMIVVVVIIVNGAFLNLMISPQLVHISFGERHHHMRGELHRIRKIAFALGAVSLTSWYSAFVLGVLRSTTLGFWTLLALYVGMLAVMVGVSQLMERLIARQAPLQSKHTETVR